MIKDEELLSIDRKYLNHRGRKAADLAQITKDYADSMKRVPATQQGAVELLDNTIDALSRLRDVLRDQDDRNEHIKRVLADAVNKSMQATDNLLM